MASNYITPMQQKRGRKQNLPILKDGELGYCIDTNELYIGYRGYNKLINPEYEPPEEEGPDNITAEYIKLLSPNGTEFKIAISNTGEFVIDRIIPEIESSYDGLVINQVYGGGIPEDNGTSVTHSFIELYNTSDKNIVLDNLSVQYAKSGTEWFVLPLRGNIMPKCSHLIRCGRHSEDTSPSVHVIIDEFDQEWNLHMYNKGIKVALVEGTKPIDVENPYAKNAEGKRFPGYIDMIGCTADGGTIDGSETTFVEGQSKQKSVRRVKFADTQHNEFDCEIVDFRLEENAWKIPHTSQYGAWNEGGQIPSDADYAFIKINQVYGGDKLNTNETSGSHSFVELYNTHKTKTINLGGCSIQVSDGGTVWTKFDLTGNIPPRHSFLLRGMPHTDLSLASVKISNFDQDEPTMRMKKGLKCALLKSTELLTVANPWNTDGMFTKVEGYIDLIGVAGNDPGKTIDGFEGEYGSYLTGNSKQRSIRRLGFVDTDNNLNDCEICNYQEDFALFKDKQPRYLAYGAWEDGEPFEKEEAPITITSSFNKTEVVLGEELEIPYLITSPKYEASTFDVTYTVDGVASEGITASVGENIWAVEPLLEGTHTLTIKVSLTDGEELMESEELTFTVKVIKLDDSDVTYPSESIENYKGLIINQIYGGGPNYDNSTACTHTFVELYNTTDRTLNLEGMSLQYSPNNSTTIGWEKLNLKGSIPPKHSFLVRGDIHSDPGNLLSTVTIDKYDQEWALRIYNKGAKVALVYGTFQITVTNPAEAGNRLPELIDMIGCSGNTVGNTVDGFEGEFIFGQSKQKAIRRIDFVDTDNNSNDCMIVDYRYFAENYNYVPRYLEYGAWDETDKLPEPEITLPPFDPNKPNYVTSVVSGDAATERTVIWYSGAGNASGLLVINDGVTETTEFCSTLEIELDDNTSITRHCATVKGLTPNTTYTYKVTVGGTFGDNEYKFTTASLEGNKEFSFVQISDTQCTSPLQFKVVGDVVAAEATLKPFELLIHTGDIVESSETIAADDQDWKDYLNGLGNTLGNTTYVQCAGNNDMDLGSLSMNNWNKYYTVGEQDVTKGYYSFTYENTFFIVLNSELHLEEQKVWLQEQLSSEAATNARWRIVAMHRSMYTSEKDLVYKDFATIMETGNVDILIQGHKHMYMRSKPMANDSVDETNGILYIMCNRSGLGQNSGKTLMEWMEVKHEPMKPSINRFTINDQSITIEAKYYNEGSFVHMETFVKM